MNRRTFIKRTSAVTMATTLTGCETPSTEQSAATTEPPTETAPGSRPAAVANPDYVMTATDSAFTCGVNLTDLKPTSNFEEDAIVFAGPLAFTLARAFASGDLRGDAGPFSRWKSPTGVKQTQAVTLVVPPAERDTAALWFGPVAVDDSNPAITDGFQSVRFEPCNVSSPSSTAWTVWPGVGFWPKTTAVSPSTSGPTVPPSLGR